MTLKGSAADDPEYFPAWQQMKETIGHSDFLFVGDCKMGYMKPRNNKKTVDDSIDKALDDFKRISKEVSELEKTQWSEADTRLKVIDQILFDVLGWSKNDAAVEGRAGTGYTDYTLRIGRSARLIVEAKKDAVSFDLCNRTSGSAYKLNGSVFNPAAKKAIEQAIFYSALKSSELACVTNGSEWIVFRANRLGDGQDTLDGKAFIFSSLSEIQNNFLIYYDIISRTIVDPSVKTTERVI